MAEQDIMERKKVEGSSNEASCDIENPNIKVVTTLKDKLARLSSLSSHSHRCIYRVPEKLKSTNNKMFYTPQVISIGPLHHHNKDLAHMEDHKRRYLRDFLSRTGVSLEDYVKKVKDQTGRLRDCYHDEGTIQSFKHDDDFISMILVDAAFVIELLLRHYSKTWQAENDWIFKNPWMLQNILHDMLLLENQLPFFILEDLYNPTKVKSILTGRRAWTVPSIIELSYKFFEKAVRLEETEENLKDVFSSSSEGPLHFVDFLRTLHLQYMDTSQAGGPLQSTSSMTKLHQAGVKFQMGSGKNLFDIRFDKGTLKIPKLQIHDYTERTLRNLIAFEQRHCMQHYLSDYVFILDKFVNTIKDVELLVEDDIVVNTLGDNIKVTNLINNLCTGVALNHNNYYFAALSENLNKHCKKPTNRWKANLRQKYFNTPWAALSLLAAVILLLLTVIQTVFSVIGQV